MEVYFDNAATTKVSESTAEAMMKSLTSSYGNPSSLHKKGYEAEVEVEKSRQIIAGILKVPKKEVYFTSGGTEGSNIIIFGILDAYKRRGKHILVSSIEHPSVKEAMIAAEDIGYEVELIPVDANGYIQLEVLLGMIRTDTVLVSIMHVNNEIGVIQDIEAIGKGIKAKNPTTFFHVDAVQSFGKYVLNPLKQEVDAVTISAHKIHGPKGSGAIYVSGKVRMTPMLHGGSQQRGVRSGTENVPGIIGLGIAAKEAYEALEENRVHINGIKTYMLHKLKEEIESIEFNGDVESTAYHILNIRVVGVKSEVLLHTLEEAGIYVSTGSACSSNKKNHSSTLMALGQNSDQTDQAIRLSFSKYNTKDEVDYFIEQLKKDLPMLRRFVRK